jgi:AbrB family looped-hinge helix DNA binding protein
LGGCWYHGSMRVSVDKVGRIVIPKRLRDQAGIGAETELDIVFDGVAITLEPVVTHERIIDRRDGLPLLRAVPDGVLTDDVVRALRDEQR